MKPETLHLCAWLAENDAKIPEGELTWTLAVQNILFSVHGLPSPYTPEGLIEAVAVGSELNRSRERAAENVKGVMRSKP